MMRDAIDVLPNKFVWCDPAGLRAIGQADQLIGSRLRPGAVGWPRGVYACDEVRSANDTRRRAAAAHSSRGLSKHTQ